MNGFLNACNHIYLAETASQIGLPTESFESEHVTWIPLTKIPGLIRDRQIIGGTTMSALLLAARTRSL